MLNLRREERRPVLAAFAFLTALILSHAVLETARDAAFLARLPATRLPVVYVGVAILSLLVARIDQRSLKNLAPRTALVVWSTVAFVGTLGIYWIVPGQGDGGRSDVGLYVLYLWSGVIAAVTLVRFWSLLGAAFAITQAKRLYPIIGAGSVVGALAGSALASALAGVVRADILVLVAAGGFAIAAVLARTLSFHPTTAEATATEPRPALDRSLSDAALFARHPYVRRVGIFVVVSAATFTLGDFAWKSTVASSVPPEALARTIATLSLVANVLSLGGQLMLAPWIFRRFDVGVALAVLPVLLAISGVGLGAGLGLAAAIFLRGTDGALRYSMHRTASEILYVPLPEATRGRVRAALDVVGQRSGQTLASLLLLAAAAASAPAVWIFGLLAAFAAASAASALGLRRHYVDLLKSSVSEGGALRATAYPELDLGSLETLLAALDSTDEAEVLAALDVFERDGKARLVPALLLRHPSEAVVERTLVLFARTRRANALAIVDDLDAHPSVRVRCAAIATRAAITQNPRRLLQRLDLEESPEVRATLVVHLIAAGEIAGDDARSRLAELTRSGRASTKIALARAIAARDAAHLDDALVGLAASIEPEVRVAAISAMAEHPREKHHPALITALADERTRRIARAALLGLGDEGFAVTRRALDDTALPDPVRWEVPAALAQFQGDRAATALLERLARESNGMVRYRILRSLEAAVARTPTVSLDRARLDAEIARTVTQAYERMHGRMVMEREVEREPARRTPGHLLLRDLLANKEDAARDRLLRLLGLQHPSADFESVRRGLRSPSKKKRASAVEIVESTLKHPLREAVVGLVDDRPDAERLAAAGPFHRARETSYEALLDTMLTSSSEALQDLAAYHAGELALSGLRDRVAELAAGAPARRDLQRALEHLGAGPTEAAPC